MVPIPHVKKGKLEKYVIADSPIHGKGLYAAMRFRKGERILQFDDTRAVTDEHPLNPEDGEVPRRIGSLQGGKTVLLQTPECYINHSCDPNCYTHTQGSWRYLIALREIRAGEEVTYDYAINNSTEYVGECRCGSQRCRGTLHGDFFQLPRETQIAYLPLLDCWFVDEHAEQLKSLRDTV
ncbi:MAG: SET domain-containing protein-lysine N-methyltransferase [Anaerolineaceae bacterium]|nr:SET domain-containing protein-lysine N-methyltransferase [Anaerolineaceae bacterium]